MRSIHRSGMAFLLTALCGLAVGCCDKEKKDIQYLTQQNLDLANKNKDIQAQLASARTRESQLMSQLDSKDLEMTALRTDNEDLRRKLGTGGAPPPPPPGGAAETTVYTETVGSDVLFDAGKAELTASGKAKLDEIVSMLRSRFAGLGVRVYGYTDSDPIKVTRNLWTDNLDLSANRAMAVTRYLTGKGISAEMVETVAMGATHFVADNTGKDGKAKNRRVEIKVVRK